jgi:outer membrane protein TolC
VGINLPVRRERRRAEVAAAQARLDESTAELQQLTDTLRAAAVAADAHRQEMTHLVELYHDRVLPAARDQVAAARASFESGHESMLGLIEAARSLRDAEQQYHQAVAGLARALAVAARTLGELPGHQAPAGPPPAEELP